MLLVGISLDSGSDFETVLANFWVASFEFIEAVAKTYIILTTRKLVTLINLFSH